MPISFLGVPDVATQVIVVYVAGILQYGFLGYRIGLILNELIQSLIKGYRTINHSKS
jgi:hypothetical protein